MPLARTTDPFTSHLAAKRVEDRGSAESQRIICLRWVENNPGWTSAEIARELGLDRYTPSRRLPELRGMGLVRNGEARKCRVGGMLCMTWLPVLRNGLDINS